MSEKDPSDDPFPGKYESFENKSSEDFIKRHSRTRAELRETIEFLIRHRELVRDIKLQKLESEWQYTRTLQPRADGGALFLTNGNGPPGSTGRLLRSADAGLTWEDAGLPGETNSTPWCIATNPADPMLIFTVTNLGQLFRSSDGGASWVKLAREFGEVRSMVWQPA